MKISIGHHINKIKTADYLKIFILRTIGNFLIISSLFMIAKTFYQPVKEEIIYFIETKAQKEYLAAGAETENKIEKDYSSDQPKSTLAQLLNIKKVEVLNPINPEFNIIIPKIGANSQIIANVDSGNEQEYLEVLKKGVAQALGTSFPGEGGHVFLFAHSTDYFWNVGSYNAVFYLLSKLEVGDEVDLYYKGQRYVYNVTGTKIVDPSEVEYLTRKTNREFLTLQTCWPAGTTLKRLLVFAERKVE